MDRRGRRGRRRGRSAAGRRRAVLREVVRHGDGGARHPAGGRARHRGRVAAERRGQRRDAGPHPRPRARRGRRRLRLRDGRVTGRDRPQPGRSHRHGRARRPPERPARTPAVGTHGGGRAGRRGGRHPPRALGEVPVDQRPGRHHGADSRAHRRDPRGAGDVAHVPHDRRGAGGGGAGRRRLPDRRRDRLHPHGGRGPGARGAVLALPRPRAGPAPRAGGAPRTRRPARPAPGRSDPDGAHRLRRAQAAHRRPGREVARVWPRRVASSGATPLVTAGAMRSASRAWPWARACRWRFHGR